MIKNHIEARLEQELFGPSRNQQIGLFDYITDDMSIRSTELNQEITQSTLKPVLEQKMELNTTGKLSVGNVTIENVVNKLQQGELTQGEMMFFINNLRNRAAYIKGNLFANDQDGDEQL